MVRLHVVTVLQEKLVKVVSATIAMVESIKIFGVKLIVPSVLLVSIHRLLVLLDLASTVQSVIKAWEGCVVNVTLEHFRTNQVRDLASNALRDGHLDLELFKRAHNALPDPFRLLDRRNVLNVLLVSTLYLEMRLAMHVLLVNF